jgi:hypothetical protein
MGAILLAGLVALWPRVVAAADLILDQEQALHTTKGTADEMDIQPTQPKAQTFRPGRSGPLQQVSVMLFGLCSVCTGQRVQVDIVQGLPGAGGPVLATAVTTVRSGLFDETWYDLSFAAPPVVMADQTYSLILREAPPVSGGVNGSLGVSYTCWGKEGADPWPCTNGSGIDAYPRGNLWYFPGDAWHQFSGAAESDLTFKTWMAPANQPPVLSGVPAALTVDEDGSAAITGISVGDPDVGGNPLLVTLAAGHGSLTLGTTGGLTFTAGANGGTAMTFAGTLPAVNAAIGHIEYRPAPNYNGSDQVTLTVSDQGYTGSGGPLMASGTTAITVMPVNDAPVFTAASTNTMQTVPEQGQLTALAATDLEGDTLTFAKAQGSLPDGVTLNPDGSFTGTLSYQSAGTYQAVVAVSDGQAVTTGLLTIIVTNVDTTPALAPIPDQTNRKNDRVTLAVTAADVDGDALTFRAEGLPAGLTIDPATGTITGRIDRKAAGDYHAVVFAVDSTPVNGAEHSGSVSFTWTVAKRVIKGVVTDAATGAPVPGVLVVIRDAGGAVVSRTTTDGAGSFTAELPDGNYTITLTAPGYQPGTGEVAVGPETGDLSLVLAPQQ